MQKYGKAIFAVLATLAVFIIQARSGGITPVEWAETGGVGAVAVSTWLVPVVPQFPSLKTWVAFVVMFAAALGGVLNDGWSVADLTVLLVEIGAFFGIALAPASSKMTRSAVGWGSDARIIDGTFTTRTGPAL